MNQLPSTSSRLSPFLNTLRSTIAAVVVSTAAVGLVGCAAKPTGPNVVVIVTDDARYDDLGFSGSGVVPTPAIDRIADEGVAFSAGYVTASVCSPSRAGLLTGRYQQRFGHEFNLNGQHEQQGLGMPADEVTIAEHLQEAGYATAAFGKWHVGAAEGLQPVDQGFDEFHGLLQGSRSFYKLEPGVTRGVLRDGRDPIVEPDDLYLTDWIGDRANDFIRAQTGEGDGTPFFMYVSYTAPHTPMHATEDDLAWARERLPADTSERRLTYAAMTRSLDRSVGEVLNTLESVGVADDTIVFFVNDNGGATNNGSDNGRYRGMKGSKWEGGIRVPFAMRWPAGVRAGTVYGAPVSTLDITATALAAAGIEAPESAPLDGVDLVPHARGEADGTPHEALYWRRGVAAAMLKDGWKLLRVRDNPTLLFNLRNDPSEQDNLAELHPDRVEAMLAALAAWEAGLAEPGWSEGEKWERNQLRKHRMEVRTRAQERRYP